MFYRTALLLTLAGFITFAETNSVPSTTEAAAASPPAPPDQAAALKAGRREEQIRTACIEGRRYISGRVVQVTAEGLVVDSGYKQLLSPPFNRSWIVRGTALVDRDPHAVEAKRPDAVCVGLVFLSNIPKRPAVRNYDYVLLHGYPAGHHLYVPVPGVEKTIRRFSASLERAVEINLDRERK